MKIVCGFNLWNDVPNRDPNRVVVMKAHSINAVSYTHLTLPTIYSV